MRWDLSAYCTDCGFDILSAEDDDLDTLVSDIESKADYLYREHINQGKCT